MKDDAVRCIGMNALRAHDRFTVMAS